MTEKLDNKQHTPDNCPYIDFIKKDMNRSANLGFCDGCTWCINFKYRDRRYHD